MWQEFWVLCSPLAAAGQWAASGGSVAAPALALAASAAVLLALGIDHVWGEPPARLHPVVWLGHVLGWWGKKIAPSQEVANDYKSFVLGIIVWTGLAALSFAVYAAVQAGMAYWAWGWQALAMGVLLKPLLSWRMLRCEVQAVEEALQTSLAQGRERLSWLVSRDTSQLDAGVVRESAIETLAENLSDSVVAPLFWFAVGGLPGAALYRMANTADAMWGYPGWRGGRYWQWAGKWAARVDDALNWVPARMTAVLLALVARGVQWRSLCQQAALTPSPNGGWPMGAMAQVLHVRLGKPGVYVLHATGHTPQRQHVQRALRVAGRVVAVLALLALCATVGWMQVM